MGWEADRKDPGSALNRPARTTSRKGRGKRDTRKWCHGRKGREHTLEIAVGKWAAAYRRDPPCKYYGTYRRTIAGPVEIGKHWSCCHEEVCIRCGKILRHSIPKEECPAWQASQGVAANGA